MCTTCGCGGGDLRIGNETMHAHSHEHAHTHEGASEATRKILVEEDILARNNAYAARNREAFSRSATLALNLVSSPGSGKTTLLTRTLSALKADVPLAVIEGDQESELDAERIRAEAVPALQINTGKGCHLDAHMIGHALERLRPPEAGILFIENVGNLVCPAAFDLGESAKILILSVTEGEDKPLKYPDMFHAARLLIINKTDLLPHVRFSVETATDYARRIHPQMEVVTLSASTGEGFDVWLAWLTARLTEIKNARALELEAELARLKA